MARKVFYSPVDMQEISQKYMRARKSYIEKYRRALKKAGVETKGVSSILPTARQYQAKGYDYSNLANVLHALKTANLTAPQEVVVDNIIQRIYDEAYQSDRYGAGELIAWLDAQIADYGYEQVAKATQLNADVFWSWAIAAIYASDEDSYKPCEERLVRLLGDALGIVYTRENLLNLANMEYPEEEY